MIVLSVMICSLKSRYHLLPPLLKSLNTQKTREVEILVDLDDKIPIGAKRNELLKRARGKYVTFIDDDDLISEDYIAKILKAVSSEPDCCGMEGIITFDGGSPRRFIHSIRYDHWFEKDGTYYRPPNHLSIIRREIALRVMFPPISFREDLYYSMGLRSLLAHEVYIPGPIYYYRSTTPYMKWVLNWWVPRLLGESLLFVHRYFLRFCSRFLKKEAPTKSNVTYSTSPGWTARLKLDDTRMRSTQQAAERTRRFCC